MPVGGLRPGWRAGLAPLPPLARPRPPDTADEKPAGDRECRPAPYHDMNNVIRIEQVKEGGYIRS